jgi:uncharacterized membrane protein (GlpM family)
MISSETVTPAKPVAVQVVKICLIISTVIGTLVIILRLISGETIFHAVSAVVPAVSILAVLYLMILSQSRTTAKMEDGVTHHAEMAGKE